MACRTGSGAKIVPPGLGDLSGVMIGSRKRNRGSNWGPIWVRGTTLGYEFASLDVGALKGHMNIRILQPCSKSKAAGIQETMVCRIFMSV